ncbi:hypothetical protein T484DRAFT_1898957 [Baffinella frigidus]|nr:hypothetical protein T484DRAFT_1898957 [Cryptophyta sp. CCMP2293]
MSSPADVLAMKIKKAQAARKERWRMQMDQMLTSTQPMIIHDRNEEDEGDARQGTIPSLCLTQFESAEPAWIERAESGGADPVQTAKTERLRKHLARYRASARPGAGKDGEILEEEEEWENDPMGIMIGLEEEVGSAPHEPLFLDALHGNQ